MEISTVVNGDRTITIPAKIREILGSQEGVKVECTVNGARLEVRVLGTKALMSKSKLTSGYGMIKSNRPSLSVDLNIGDHITVPA